MIAKEFVWHKSSVSIGNGLCVEVGQWHKASFSFANGNCVEVGAWNKATRSFANGNCVEAGAWHKATISNFAGNCVESTMDEQVVLVRDTKVSRLKDDDAPVQSYTLKQWQKLIDVVKAGKFMVAGRNSLKLSRGVKLELKKVGDRTEWHLSGQSVVHSYTKGEMDAFIEGVKNDEFDLAPELALQLAAA